MLCVLVAVCVLLMAYTVDVRVRVAESLCERDAVCVHMHACITHHGEYVVEA